MQYINLAGCFSCYIILTIGFAIHLPIMELGITWVSWMYVKWKWKIILTLINDIAEQ